LNEITQILLECRAGDAGAFDRLMPHVYDELRKRARRYMSSERPDHTLQTTGLVHEAYLKLIDVDIPWKDRLHFFATAARSMRRILVDHARAHHAERRGGGQRPISLNETAVISSEPSRALLLLDDALKQLATFDERKGRIVELRFFAGLTHQEIADALGVSIKTVEREMRLTRAWLHREMECEV
jgi:RNA polymerase sigma factor (TIGR02999 family)